jgi:ribosomal protein L12E/L44/L45/RPP1/RPP2
MRQHSIIHTNKAHDAHMHVQKNSNDEEEEEEEEEEGEEKEEEQEEEDGGVCGLQGVRNSLALAAGVF